MGTAPPAAWPHQQRGGAGPGPGAGVAGSCGGTAAPPPRTRFSMRRALAPPLQRNDGRTGAGNRGREPGPPRRASRPALRRQALLPWQRVGRRRGDVRRTAGRGAASRSLRTAVPAAGSGRSLLSGSRSFSVSCSGRRGRRCLRGSWRQVTEGVRQRRAGERGDCCPQRQNLPSPRSGLCENKRLRT